MRYYLKGAKINVLLIHLNPLIKTFQLGLAYIASTLREDGHNLAFLSFSVMDKMTIEKEIEKNKSEIVLVSVTTDAYELCKKLVSFISKKYNLPILLGGIHPTVCPDECMELDGLLGICIGEGEHAARELLAALVDKRGYTNIENLWIKQEGVIHKNDPGALIQNLDDLPLPDYGIFRGHINFRILPVILSRGCPFNCTYCCNHSLQKLYQGKGKFLRYHSIDYSMRLLAGLLKQFTEIQEIEFYDDTFTINKQWLRDFLKEFSKLKIKFGCNSRFDILDEDLIKLLADSGCVRMNVAVESGNERIRREVLGRSMSNAVIIEKSRLMKKYNIRLHTHNMVGIPYETEENILETIELNRKIQPDSVVVSVFNPYPKTDLGELCIEKNWIDKRLKTSSYFDFTVLKTPYISPDAVNYYFLVFSSMVYDSGFVLQVKKAIFWILHLKNNFLYVFMRNILLRKLSANIYNKVRKLMRNI